MVAYEEPVYDYSMYNQEIIMLAEGETRVIEKDSEGFF
jgi:hypothetical protein